jgi:trimeric autotransporter adhesin
VRAYRDNGQYSSWSAVWSFRTAMKPPVLTAPADGATFLETKSPQYSWNSVSGAVSYMLQVSVNSNMASPFINITTASITYTPAAEPPRGKQLWWRVKANGANSSDWTVPRSFTSANPPSVPVLMEPVVNTLTTMHKPWFDWKDSALPAGTFFKGYHLQIATDSEFNNLIDINCVENNLNVSEMARSECQSTPALNPNTLYYWRVNACNTLNQCSPWSSAWYFRTALPEPVLIAPTNGDTLLTQRPTFNWASVSGAASYTLQVSINSNMASPLINATITSSNYTSFIDLPKGTNLYWWVKANGANPSGWSEKRSFSIP